VATVGLVLGTTAAAYAGALPAQVQDFAHRFIDAPAAHHAADPHPGREQHGKANGHRLHQPPGLQRHPVPAGKAKGHLKHPSHKKAPNPANSPKPGRRHHHPPSS